jgi:site-specific DNA recombinase
MPPIRAATYARISRDARELTHLGTDRQEADCHALIEARGWTAAKTYTDNDTSATSKRRPGYEAMMRALAVGEVDALVAYAPDRFYRRLADLVGFMDAVKAANAEVATVAGGVVDLNSAIGRMSAGHIGVAAAYEVERTSERIRRQQQDAAKNGRPHFGGKRSFGFEPDRVTHNQIEADAIREATTMLLAGSSLRSVCKHLNDQGHRTVTGKRWDSPVLTTLLLRSRMIGQRSYNGVTSQATWEPIITEGEQARLRLIVAARSSAGRGASPTYLLSGLMFCAICGAKVKHCPGGRGRGASYQCPSARGDRGGRQCVNVLAAKAEAYIESVVLAITDSMPIDYPDASSTPIDNTATLDEQEDEAARGYVDGRVTLRQMQVITEAIADQRTALTARLADKADADAKRATQRQLAGRLRSLWPGMTTDDRRAAVAAVLGRITLDRAGRTLDVPTRRPTTAGDLLAARFSFDVSADHLAVTDAR